MRSQLDRLVLLLVASGCGSAPPAPPVEPAAQGRPVERAESEREAHLLALEAERDGDVLVLPAGWLDERPRLRAAVAPGVRALAEEWRFVVGRPAAGPDRWGDLLGRPGPEQDSIEHTWLAAWYEELEPSSDAIEELLQREGFAREPEDRFGAGLTGGFSESGEPPLVRAYRHPDGTTATVRVHAGETELSVTVREPMAADAAGRLVGALGRRIDDCAPLASLIDDVPSWTRVEVRRYSEYAAVYFLESGVLAPAVGARVEQRLRSLPVEAWTNESGEGRLFRGTDPERICYVELSANEPATTVRLLSEPPF